MRITLGLALLVLLGCSCGAPAATSRGTATPSSSQADYEVHEWGLVRATPGDVLNVGAIAPPVSMAAMAVDKPVLYFHSAEPLTLSSVTVTMAGGGRLAEVWPLVPFDTTARWENVALALGACAPSPLPTPTEPPCVGVSGQCESTSLGLVRTDDAACLTVGASTERFLFYRAEQTRFTPPLVFERTHQYEQVEVRNEGDAPIPGMLVRLWSDGMRTQALVVSPPPPHGSVVVGNDFAAAAADEDEADRPVAVDDRRSLPSTVEPARAAIRETMTGIGLTESEADAFLNAWSAALFPQDGAVVMDGVSVDALTAVDRGSVDGELAPRESFVYFLPESTTNGIAELSFEPAPRAVHRAIAVWSPLRSSGASH